MHTYIHTHIHTYQQYRCAACINQSAYLGETAVLMDLHHGDIFHQPDSLVPVLSVVVENAQIEHILVVVTAGQREERHHSAIVEVVVPLVIQSPPVKGRTSRRRRFGLLVRHALERANLNGAGQLVPAGVAPVAVAQA